MTLESESIIPKRNSDNICFDKKMANISGEGFLLTTKFYKSAHNADILSPDKRNPEGKSDVQPEGTGVKKQNNTTTKRISLQKIHANNIHKKLGHTREDMMGATVKRLNYSIKEMIAMNIVLRQKSIINCYIKWRRSVILTQAK